MQLRDILQAVPTMLTGVALSTPITSVCCDSRKVIPGAAFVAISGTKENGECYIQDALRRGAAVIVSEKKLPGPSVQVVDARQALAQMSGNFYGNPARKLTLIGVTGTNGKSSVTWMLRQVLMGLTGERVGLVGTVENCLGDVCVPAARTTPQSDELQAMLARMVAGGCKYAVLEVSSHAVAQKRTAGLQFAVGAFTNLSQDHLDYHGSMENYFAAKAKLFAACQKAVCNLDDPWATRLSHEQMLTVSAQKEAHIQAWDIRMDAAGVAFRAVAAGEQARVCVPIAGSFTVDNALTVLGICRQLGFGLHETAEQLKNVQGIRGRMERVKLPGVDFTVLIDYAHTPDALEKLLKSLRPVCRGRLIVLFGCGGDRDKEKRPQMGRIATQLADLAIITSDNPRFEEPGQVISDILKGVCQKTACKVLENRENAIQYAMDIGKKHDIIVLAGKGHEVTQEIRGVLQPFDERQILYKILSETR